MREKQAYLNIGEGRVVNEPTILEAVGIGSCIVICLYDKEKRVAGMVHALLGNNPHDEKADLNPMRFADTAIDLLLGEMAEKGCQKGNIVAKIFGGAKLFTLEHINVGEDNIFAVRQKLEEVGIPIVAEDTGGKHGRNIWFDTENGKVVVGRVFGPTLEY
ncbi:MAG: chemotaxis protein CheD [Candidatus Altiarchaeota archaeon]|nr:chemotaxis protein CheD [Candidatus Altiarchaeota archaeon]